MKFGDQSYNISLVLVLSLFVHSICSVTLNGKYRMNAKYFKSFKDVEIIQNNHSIRKYDNITAHELINAMIHSSNTNDTEAYGTEFKNMSITNITREDLKPSDNFNMSDVSDSHSKCKCNCSCGSNREEAVNIYTLHYSDDDDGHEDDDHTDDIDDLEKIQNPYNFIPQETIELSHRPDNLLKPSTTPSRPQHTSNIYSSLLPSSLYPSPSKPITKPPNTSLSPLGTYAQIGLTVILSVLMVSAMIPFSGARRLNERNERSDFQIRQNKPNIKNKDGDYDSILIINELLQRLKIKYD